MPQLLLPADQTAKPVAARTKTKKKVNRKKKVKKGKKGKKGSKRTKRVKKFSKAKKPAVVLDSILEISLESEADGEALSNRAVHPKAVDAYQTSFT